MLLPAQHRYAIRHIFDAKHIQLSVRHFYNSIQLSWFIIGVESFAPDYIPVRIQFFNPTSEEDYAGCLINAEFIPIPPSTISIASILRFYNVIDPSDLFTRIA